MVKAKILVVDSSESTRVFLRFILSNAGFLVLAVKSVEEAMNEADDFPFDAVITDLLPPEMAGIQLVRELRSHKWYEDKPLIIVSLDKTESVIQQGLDAGATEWVVKPVSPNKLIALIKELCPDKEDEDDF